jgi:hypothetical protein
MPPKQKKKLGRPLKKYILPETPPPPSGILLIHEKPHAPLTQLVEPAMPLETLADAAHSAQAAQLPHPHQLPLPNPYPQPTPLRPSQTPHPQPYYHPAQPGATPPPRQMPQYEGYPAETMHQAHHVAYERYAGQPPPVPPPATETVVQPWERLYKAKGNLEKLRELPIPLSSENRVKITDAINYIYHILSPYSTDIPDTPRVYSAEFKRQASTLAAEYVKFSLDALPTEQFACKLFLDNIDEKLIKPITARESIWEDHGIRLNEAWIKWDECNRTLLAEMGAPPQSSPSGDDQLSTNFANEPAVNEPRETGVHGGRRPTPFQAPPVELLNDPRSSRPGAQPQQPRAQNLNAGTADRDLMPPPQIIPHQIPRQSQAENVRRAVTAPPEAMEVDSPAEPTPSEDSPPRIQRWQLNRSETVPPRSLESYHPRVANFTNEITRNKDQQGRQQPKIVVKTDSRHVGGSLAESTDENEFVSEDGFEMHVSSDMDRPPSIAYSLGVDGHSESQHDDRHFGFPPKRPASRSSEDCPPAKQQRTNRMPISVPARPLNREEIEKQHHEDHKFMAHQADVLEEEGEADDPNCPTRKTIRRSLSQHDIEIVRTLTPALQEMNTSDRETSPPRQTWKTPSPTQTSSPGDPHILPRGGNILGAQSSANLGFHPLGFGKPDGPSINPTRFNDRHLDPVSSITPNLNPANHEAIKQEREDLAEAPPVNLLIRRNLPAAASGSAIPAHERKRARDDVQWRIGPEPKSTFDLLDLMNKHDRENRNRPTHMRSFYVPLWALRLIDWDSAAHTGDNRQGPFDFVRYFSLSPREIEESDQYVRFIRGDNARGAKIMIRVRCMMTPADGNGDEVVAWPLNTRIILNGQELRTAAVSFHFSPRLTTGFASIHFVCKVQGRKRSLHQSRYRTTSGFQDPFNVSPGF